MASEGSSSSAVQTFVLNPTAESKKRKFSDESGEKKPRKPAPNRRLTVESNPLHGMQASNLKVSNEVLERVKAIANHMTRTTGPESEQSLRCVFYSIRINNTQYKASNQFVFVSL